MQGGRIRRRKQDARERVCQCFAVGDVEPSRAGRCVRRATPSIDTANGLQNSKLYFFRPGEGPLHPADTIMLSAERIFIYLQGDCGNG